MRRVAPGWVRARTLAAFQLVMQGGEPHDGLAGGLASGRHVSGGTSGVGEDLLHDPPHLAATEIQIVRLFVVRDQKPISIWMGMDSSAHETLAIRYRVVILFKTDQLSLARQLAEGVDNEL
jgi:hypothetical protein